MSHSDISQQRYEPPYDGDVNATLQTHNRLLYIGLGIALVGIIVLLAIVISDGSDDLPAPPPRPSSSMVPAATQNGSDPETPETATAAVARPAAPPPRTLTPEPVRPEAFRAEATARANTTDGGLATAGNEAITLHVVSTPPSAEVLLAGKPIGTTPLTVRMPRGSGVAPLTIRRARFADATTNVDLGGDVSREVTLTAITDDAATKPPAIRTDRTNRTATHDGKPHPTPGAAAVSPCQRADRINPFDDSCGGKPCPVCAPERSQKPPSP
jgi:hypothetical protein